jgi:hypothetical protein
MFHTLGSTHRASYSNGFTNTKNTPIEAPGGDGIERDLLMLEDVTVSLITERRGRNRGV